MCVCVCVCVRRLNYVTSPAIFVGSEVVKPTLLNGKEKKKAPHDCAMGLCWHRTIGIFYCCCKPFAPLLPDWFVDDALNLDPSPPSILQSFLHRRRALSRSTNEMYQIYADHSHLHLVCFFLVVRLNIFSSRRFISLLQSNHACAFIGLGELLLIDFPRMNSPVSASMEALFGMQSSTPFNPKKYCLRKVLPVCLSFIPLLYHMSPCATCIQNQRKGDRPVLDFIWVEAYLAGQRSERHADPLRSKCLE